MGEVVNLNRFRKSRERAAAEHAADENRLRFGRRKDERQKVKHETDKAAKTLDDKRLE